MANTFIPNKLTDLIAVRAAESGNYLTVGSKSYFADQLRPNVREDSGSMRLVVRDAGKFVSGKSLSAGDKSTLKERPVDVTPNFGNVVIDTDQYTDVIEANWDKEIAIPCGKALIEGVVSNAIRNDLGRQNIAFVGTGFLPLTKASRALGSITSDNRYGFIDPMIDSVLSTVGKGFDPVNADPVVSKGMYGKFAGTEFREQQFLPQIEISAALAAELATATVNSYATGADYDTLTLNGVTETIPAGTPLFVAGVKATNLVGNEMSFNKAFIAIEDASAGAVKVRKVDFDGQGTKEASAKPKANDKLVDPIKAGIYYMGIIRTEGAQEFDTFKNLDWSNADQTSDNVEGIFVHEGRVVDIMAGTNTTRWTVVSLSQCVEPRCACLVLIKDADNVNLVTM